MLKMALKKDRWVKLDPVLSQGEFFDGEYKEIYDTIAGFHRKDKGRSEELGNGALRGLLQGRRSPARFLPILEALDSLPRRLPLPVEEFALRFAVRSGLQQFVAHAAQSLENSSFSLEDLRAQLNALSRVEALGHEGVIDYDKVGPEVARKLLDGRVSTGFPTVDSSLAGGLGQGELGLVLAPAKGGKTALLMQFAINAVKKGLSVLDVTLEIGQAMRVARYDMGFTGATFAEAVSDPRTHSKALRALRRAKGKLRVLDGQGRPLTVSQIEGKIEEIRTKGPLDMVIVDYAAKVRSRGGLEGRRFEIERVTEDLRDMAKRTGLPVWSASQVNREGTQKGFFDSTHTAECWAQIGICDCSLTVLQHLRDRGQLYVKVDATRFAEEGKGAVVQADFNHMQLHEGGRDE